MAQPSPFHLHLSGSQLWSGYTLLSSKPGRTLEGRRFRFLHTFRTTTLRVLGRGSRRHPTPSRPGGHWISGSSRWPWSGLRPQTGPPLLVNQPGGPRISVSSRQTLGNYLMRADQSAPPRKTLCNHTHRIRRCCIPLALVTSWLRRMPRPSSWQAQRRTALGSNVGTCKVYHPFRKDRYHPSKTYCSGREPNVWLECVTATCPYRLLSHHLSRRRSNVASLWLQSPPV